MNRPTGAPTDPDDAVPPAPAPTASPTALRIVMAMLLLLGASTYVAAARSWSQSSVVLNPGLVAPFAAWGLWRRSPIWRLLTLGLVWGTAAATLAASLAGVLGATVRVSIGGVDISTRPTVLLLFALAMTAFALVVQVLLARPEVRAAFPSRTPRAWRPAVSLTVAGIILLTAQAAAGIAAAVLLELPPGEQSIAAVLNNGRFLTIASIVSATLVMVLVVASVLLRGDARPRAALALRPVDTRVVAAWLGATLLFLLVAVLVSSALDHPQSEFVLETYRTAHPRWLFWVAIVILTPLSEELVFRGLLFTDLTAAGLRPATVVLVTTAFFASLHVGQYAAVDFALVTALGLLLGAARARTGSVHPSIAMHVLMNGWALIGAAMTVH